MQSFRDLLLSDRSQLAWALHLSLCGLQRQLQVALESSQAGNDPGIPACQTLLSEVEALLKESPFQTYTVASEPLEVQSHPQSKSINLFQSLCDQLIANRELQNYIGLYQFHSLADTDVWKEIQFLLLRLPDRLANNWRSQLQSLFNSAQLSEDNRSVRILPFIRNEVLYSGLKGDITAQGLRLSDKGLTEQGRFDERLKVNLSNFTQLPELLTLAAIVSVCLEFIRLDLNLHHAFKVIDRTSFHPLTNQEQRARYEQLLIERWHRVQETCNHSDSIVALHYRIDLDEAIHSLVYNPPVDRHSWWGRLQQEARQTLDSIVKIANQAGHQVFIRSLWGTYADIYKYSKDDLRVDFGGVQGEVSACLRVFAKVNGEPYPGRVIYRAT